ncbi:hypothetical protein AMTRI_Chr03g51780 [Amborella trichopoda]
MSEIDFKSIFITEAIVFDPLSHDIWDPFPGFFPSSSLNKPNESTSALLNTRFDWKETDNAHVKVELEDGRVLQISGERKRENDEWHRVERSQGKFVRRFRLAGNAKVDGVKATMENGVLTVTVPKVEAPKPDVKSIEISG